MLQWQGKPVMPTSLKNTPEGRKARRRYVGRCIRFSFLSTGCWVLVAGCSAEEFIHEDGGIAVEHLAGIRSDLVWFPYQLFQSCGELLGMSFRL